MTTRVGRPRRGAGWSGNDVLARSAVGHGIRRTGRTSLVAVDTSSPRQRPGRREPNGDDGWRPARWQVVVAVGVLLLGLLVLVATGALSAREDLRVAEAELRDARAALSELDVDGALASLQRAAVRLDEARAVLDRPDLRLAGLVPVVGRDVRIARAIVVGADEVVDAGSGALAGARELLDGDLAGDGLPVREVRDLAEPLDVAREATTFAIERVEEAPARGTTAEVTAARAEFLALLRPVEDQLEAAAALAAELPAFLGIDGPRHYLLAAANPAEVRGVGGYLGSWSVLTIDDGQLEFGAFEPLEDIEPLPRSAVDRDLLADRYDRFGGTWLVKNANMSPDMPSVGRVLVEQFEVVTGRRLDGVVVVDPFALASMLRVTGPVTIDGGIVLEADTAVDYLVNRAYADYDDPDQRKSELGDAATAVLSRFLGDAGAAVDHLDELADIAGERHLLLYSSDAAEQSAFALAGLDGALPSPPGDLVAVVGNSATNAKVDYWLEQRLDYRVDLLADGVALGRLEVVLVNGAPTSGQPKYVIGPSVSGIAVGANRLWMSTYCNATCEVIGAEGGRGDGALLEQELGHPVAGTWVDIPSGGRERLFYTWRTAEAWEADDEALTYRLHVRPQTLVNPVAVRVEVAVPDGFAPATDPGEGIEVVATDEGTVLVFEDTTTRDLDLVFRLVAASP